MNLHISKSKNSESFYIAKSYVKANGSTTSTIIRKLGTLDQLIAEHGPTRDDVLAWAKQEVNIETEKYKKEKERKKQEFVDELLQNAAIEGLEYTDEEIQEILADSERLGLFG